VAQRGDRAAHAVVQPQQGRVRFLAAGQERNAALRQGQGARGVQHLLVLDQLQQSGAEQTLQPLLVCRNPALVKPGQQRPLI
jgi:hypothetical protein